MQADEWPWGEEADPVKHGRARLTATERELFDDQRHDRVRQGLRLEQERVGFLWVVGTLGQSG